MFLDDALSLGYNYYICTHTGGWAQGQEYKVLVQARDRWGKPSLADYISIAVTDTNFPPTLADLTVQVDYPSHHHIQ